MKKLPKSSFFFLILLLSSTYSNAQLGGMLRDLQGLADRAKQAQQPQAQQPQAQQPQAQQPQAQAQNLPNSASNRPIQNYDEYCNRLKSNPTLIEYSKLIIESRAYGKDFSRSITNNFIDTKDKIINQFTSQNFKLLLQNRDFTIKNRLSNTYASWAYTCAFDNKETHLLSLLDPSGSGEVLSDLEKQFNDFESRSKSSDRRVNTDGTIVENNPKTTKFFAIHYDRKTFPVDDPGSGLFATLYALALPSSDKIIELAGQETIKNITNTITSRKNIIKNENDIKLAQETEKRNSENQLAARRAQLDAAQKEESANKILQYQKTLIALNRNTLNFVQSKSDLKRAFDACIKTEEQLIADLSTDFRKQASNAKTQKNQNEFLAEASRLDGLKPFYGKGSCVSRAYSIRGLLINENSDFFKSLGTPYYLMPLQSVEKVSYLKESDFTAKGLSEFISLLGMSNSRLRDKCNSENFRIASEAAKNSNVRLNSAVAKENIMVVCDKYLDPSMEFFVQPFINHAKELAY